MDFTQTEAKILQAYKKKDKNIAISGTTSTVAIAKLLSIISQTDISQIPHLILLPHHKYMQNMIMDLKFFGFSKDVFTLPAFDVAPNSGLYPNPQVIAQRLRWLYHAFKKDNGLYLATTESFLQKTLPIDTFSSHIMHLEKNAKIPHSIDKILSGMGYFATPMVEDIGHYAIRGGIIDIFSPTLYAPIRIELFGQYIESLRLFDPKTQRSISPILKADIIPCREILISNKNKKFASQKIRSILEKTDSISQAEDILHNVVFGNYFHGIDYLLWYYYANLDTPINYFRDQINFWKINPIEISQQASHLNNTVDQIEKPSPESAINPSFLAKDIYESLSNLNLDFVKKCFEVSTLKTTDIQSLDSMASDISMKVLSIGKLIQNKTTSFEDAFDKINNWIHEKYQIIISTHTMTQANRLQSLLHTKNINSTIKKNTQDWIWNLHNEQDNQTKEVFISTTKEGFLTQPPNTSPALSPFIMPHPVSASLRFANEKFILLREEDFFGKKRTSHSQSKKQPTIHQSHLSFAEVQIGNRVVHVDHGVGIYEGLKIINIQGIDCEFIQIKYKDNNKLYLPIYKVGQIQKYSGPGILDSLGGNRWKQITIKVKSHLKDIANDLLQLYAKRAKYSKESFASPGPEFKEFEAYFPYEETQDQIKAISDVISDMTSSKPMDRLICGDVGFGKTEVAMRAAFHCVLNKKQCMILVPTTILCFQHYETFQNRFKRWPINIKHLSRLTSTKDQKQILQDLKLNKIDIIIGTHKLFGRNVMPSNLGLLIIDEEQRFGVSQKEKIRQIKLGADTLSLSATPIPRTLNMSLMGLRDLSLINTAPQDRLPSRTFVCKFDPQLIKKAILSEIQRGGQIFYIHNHIQSIYEEEEKLKKLLPGIKIRVGHGKIAENNLEKIMLDFLHHEFDVLLCTTIIESGIDIPQANTMIVNRADKFGLSQLYQLRGRIGRSNKRAYCYLLLPTSGRIDSIAQQRLKTLQEHSDLGSGLQIAHYDLELRGAGHLLGEAQSGHVEAVGYDLYLELLEDAIASVKGETNLSQLEPEIHIPIPALIPDKYMPDIRVRLAFYRKLSKINDIKEIDIIEEDVRDQFGEPPEPVLNLFGVMVIRFLCKQLGIRDLKAGNKNLSLTFTEQTPLSGNKVVHLATNQKKKYQITPDHCLKIKLQNLKWQVIYEELLYIKDL